MPYVWVEDPVTAPDESGAVANSDRTRVELRLWPHRSLTVAGFVAFFAITFVLVAIPLLSVIGTPILWGVLPFISIVLAGLWVALKRSYSDGAVVEVLRLGDDNVTLSRRGPGTNRASWEANPHWVKVMLHQTGGPIPNYVTLKGGGREVEIGAFLSEEERRQLHAELTDTFSRLRGR